MSSGGEANEGQRQVEEYGKALKNNKCQGNFARMIADGWWMIKLGQGRRVKSSEGRGGSRVLYTFLKPGYSVRKRQRGCCLSSSESCLPISVPVGLTRRVGSADAETTSWP